MADNEASPFGDEVFEVEITDSIDLHAFRPQDIRDLADRGGLGLDGALAAMREAGVDSVPGTGIKVASERVRRRIAPDVAGLPARRTEAPGRDHGAPSCNPLRRRRSGAPNRQPAVGRPRPVRGKRFACRGIPSPPPVASNTRLRLHVPRARMRISRSARRRFDEWTTGRRAPVRTVRWFVENVRPAVDRCPGVHRQRLAHERADACSHARISTFEWSDFVHDRPARDLSKVDELRRRSRYANSRAGPRPAWSRHSTSSRAWSMWPRPPAPTA